MTSRLFSRPTLSGILLSGTCLLALHTSAFAQTSEARLAVIEQRLEAQERQLSEQQAELDRLKAERDALWDLVRAGQAVSPTRIGPETNAAIPPRPQTILAQNDAPAPENLPARPVGEAPPSERQVRDVAALPERAGVLTPKGRFVLTPSFEYVRTSNNRLVFRGVEIVPGIQLGVIEANDADRDSLVATAALRYGLTRRLEVEARIPYVYRHDRVTTVAQRDETITRTMELEGQDMGDIEFSMRYQLNELAPGRPIFVGNARIKPPTGLGPYDVRYDEAGIATTLATGSGFWAVESGVSMLYPTDPAVIFAGITYLHNIARDVDKTIGEVLIGRVEPGDSIGANLGFGLSLNPRFSVSLGYSHNYIFPTKTQIGGTWQESNSLQVGSMFMGWSYRLTERLTFSTNFEFGVTSDAPDMRVVFSAPYRF